MFCSDRSSACSVWLSSATISWGTCAVAIGLGQLSVLTLSHTGLIFSFVSFYNYFLLLCALHLNPKRSISIKCPKHDQMLG